MVRLNNIITFLGTNMFLQNKYYKWYYDIINASKIRSVIGYTENHHIVPKSLNGSNDPDNIVKLTAREHYLCHRLLTKMTIGNDKKKMIYALWRCTNSNNYNTNSHTYENSRKLYIETLIIAKTGVKRAPFSEQTRKNMSIAHIGKPSSRKGIPMSEEQKHKLSIINKTNPPFKGKTHPPERLEILKQQMIERMSGKPKLKSPCVHCGTMCAPNMMKKWHGDLCKLRN